MRLALKIFDKWTSSLIALVLIGIVIIGAYHFGIRPNLPADEFVPISKPGDSNQMAFESIDSSNCILCHTDESVISLSTVGQEEVVESSGG